MPAIEVASGKWQVARNGRFATCFSCRSGFSPTTISAEASRYVRLNESPGAIRRASPEGICRHTCPSFPPLPDSHFPLQKGFTLIEMIIVIVLIGAHGGGGVGVHRAAVPGLR
jgi:prepilin-type N-terminal cleavage/methylation domain-containing protein